MKDSVFVAVDYWLDPPYSMSTLEWALNRFDKDKTKLVLTSWSCGTEGYKNLFIKLAESTYRPRCIEAQFEFEIRALQVKPDNKLHIFELLLQHGMKRLVTSIISKSSIEPGFNENPTLSCKTWFIQLTPMELREFRVYGPYSFQEAQKDIEEAERVAKEETKRRKSLEEQLATMTEQLEQNMTPITYISYQELEEATNNFSDSFRIGSGGTGSVYNGTFRGTIVAVKKFKLNDEGILSKFQKEVVVLSAVRHPNIVTMMGICSKPPVVVYEFLSNGSLYDYLKKAALPLLWQARTRIIAEICLALIFLHSNKPNPIIHGDLRPDNVFLDSTLTSKLSDFGIMKQKYTANNNLLELTDPDRIYAYEDPQFYKTRSMTLESDIYSFGMIVIRLLTGKTSVGIRETLAKAMEKDELRTMIDESAGTWPLHQAKEMAKIGVWCSHDCRSERPNLVNDVWPILKRLLDFSTEIMYKAE